MTCGNFDAALAAVLKHEGGYVLNPNDPGGATAQGVTQAVYDDWRSAQGLAKRPVRGIEAAEVEVIYRKRYWDKIRGDELPAGVDYCVFDFAVNSGINRAARFLQRALGAVEDGQIGPMTMMAVTVADSQALVDQICNLRLAFLKSLGTFKFFGKGWTRRVAEVRERAKGMA